MYENLPVAANDACLSLSGGFVSGWRGDIHFGVQAFRRRRIMTYFVEATRKLIQTEGVDGLSIREISNEAGYNSATIYNYFRNLEHLSLFGSACYLRDYVLALSSNHSCQISQIPHGSGAETGPFNKGPALE